MAGSSRIGPSPRPRKPRRLSTPEDVLKDSVGADVVLTLACTGCGHKSKERFSWVCVHPKVEECRTQGWEGVFLSLIFHCAKCSAVDTYELIKGSYLKLTAGVFGAVLNAPASRVFLAEMRLWDGTQVRRPSQAIRRLRELTAH